MMDVAGHILSIKEQEQISQPNIGGVILFARNYQNKIQLKQLTSSIREIKNNILIAVDHEGGRVQRFQDGFSVIPAMAEVLDEKSAFEYGKIIANELLEVGIDFSFTPVLDINYGNSSIIGNRSFSKNPTQIINLAGSLIDALHENGMKCVGKHFPGHGFVRLDSHLELPIDNRSIKEIEKDISVFKALMPKLDAIMPAHIIYSQIDDNPAGFSKFWLQDILRKKLGFKGVVFSDDLSMIGAHFIKNTKQRVKTAIDSGCDMVLVCNNPTMLKEVISLDLKTTNKAQLMRGQIY